MHAGADNETKSSAKKKKVRGGREHASAPASFERNTVACVMSFLVAACMLPAALAATQRSAFGTYTGSRVHFPARAASVRVAVVCSDANGGSVRPVSAIGNENLPCVIKVHCGTRCDHEWPARPSRGDGDPASLARRSSGSAAAAATR